jgi:iron complex outermembrane receptor protein
MRRFFLVLALWLWPAVALCETVHRLGRIVVTPSRLALSSEEDPRSVTVLDEGALYESPYDAVQDRIADVGGIDIRRRGPEGVQADVSIRGTTFEQNSVLIDGVRMNDPQTGHFNMDLPLTSFDVERAEILKGPASSLYGPNSFGGVINMVTKKPGPDVASVSATGGSYGYFSGGASVSSVSGILSNRVSIEESRSSGYMSATDFNIFAITDSALFKTYFGQVDFFLGYLKKDFGAANFYASAYPNEEEHTDTRYFKLAADVESGDLAVKPKFFLKRHFDKFQLDQYRAGWQTNYHTTYNYGADVPFVLENAFCDAVYGFEISRNTIDSTNLQTHKRTDTAIYAELIPHLAESLYLNIAFRGDYYTDFGWEYSPTVGASYRLTEDFKVRGLIGRAYRIPTFTDLYYNSVTDAGNSSLESESSWSYEAGADYSRGPFRASVTYFHRNSSDTIDWTRPGSSGRWRASNIGTVDTNGVEASLELYAKKLCAWLPVEKASFGYTAVDNYSKHDYFSKYALDYLKQEMTGIVVFDIGGFKNSWILNYKKRVGNSGYVVCDMKIWKEIVRKGKVAFEVFLDIANLSDTSYSEQSGVMMPGRWLKSGARFQW